MSVHFEIFMKNYWNKFDTKALHFLMYKHISQKKWKQIDRFFRIFRFNFKFQNVFEKIKFLNEHLRSIFKFYWSVDIHLIVNENIQRFMNKINEIINISSKSMIENFKIWILINVEYVFDWMFHVKNDKKNSVNLNKIFVNMKFFKIQIVVFDFVNQKNIKKNFRHVIWVNNFFIDVSLFSELKKKKFEIADIAKITKIVREKNETNYEIAVQKRQLKKLNKNLNNKLSEFRTKYDVQLDWKALYENLNKNEQILQFAWKDQKIVLFMTIIWNDQNIVIRNRKDLQIQLLMLVLIEQFLKKNNARSVQYLQLLIVIIITWMM